MPKSLSRLVLGVMLGGLLSVASAANGQAPVQGVGSMASGGANPFTNPYMNPYINPYLNPINSGGTMSRNDALLYLWSAQQQPGGVLSPGYQGRGARAGVSKAAEMPRSAMKPGGGAAKYFNRGTVATSAQGPVARYGRLDRYFNHNGH